MSQLDKQIKDKIYNHKSQVDAEAIWQNILPELESKTVVASHKSDNAKYIGLALLLFLFVGSVTWYSFIDSTEAGMLSETMDGLNSAKNERALLASSNSNMAVVSESTVESVVAEEGKVNGKTTSEDKVAGFITNSSSLVKAQTVAKTNTKKQLKAQQVFTKSKKATTPEIEGTTSILKPASRSKSEPKEAIQLVEKPAYYSMTSSVIDNSMTEKSASSTSLFATEKEVVLERQEQIISRLNDLDFALSTGEYAPSFSKLKKPKGKSYSEDKFQLGFGIYTGYNQDVRKLSPKAGFGELDNYIAQRNSTETSLESINAGVEALIRHRSGFQFRTGLSYTYIAERLDIGYSVTETAIIPDGILEVLIDGNGDTTFVRGPVPVQLTTEYSRQTFNYQKMWDVPLILGYRFSGTDDWNFGVEAGIHANIQTTQKGEILAASGAIVDLTESPSPFKDNVGMSVYLGLTAEYGLNDNWQLTFSPFYRNFSDSFSSSTYEVNQDYSMWGANIGVRYLFIPYRRGGKTGCPTF